MLRIYQSLFWILRLILKILIKSLKMIKLEIKYNTTYFLSGIETAYDLLKPFCFKAKRKDYDSSCFEIINQSYLKYIKKK